MPKKMLQKLFQLANNARTNISGSDINADTLEGANDLVAILAGFSLDQAPPEEVVSEESVQEYWARKTKLYTELMPGFMKSLPKDRLKDYASRQDGGLTLDWAFSRYVMTLDHLPEGMDERMYPRAEDRIEALKKKMSSGAYKTVDEKRSCLAEYIATRENVNAGMSSTNRLIKRLTPDVVDRSGKLEQDLKNIPDEDIERLYAMGQKPGFGEAMQGALYDITKTPFEKEIEHLCHDSMRYSNTSEELKKNAAKMIWLAKHKDLTREQQTQMLSSEQYESETAQLRKSPAFEKLIKHTASGELYDQVVFKDVNKLTDFYSQCAEEIELSPFSQMYDQMKNDPEKFSRLQQSITSVYTSEFIQNSELDGMAEVFRDQLKALYNNMQELPDKSTFINMMECMQGVLTGLRFSSEKNYSKNLKPIAGFETFEEHMMLPKPHTLGEYAMSLKGTILAQGDETMTLNVTAPRLMAVNEKAGDDPNWEDIPLTKEDVALINRRAQMIEGELQERYGNSEYFDDITENKAIFLVTKKEAPKDVTKFVDSWKEKQEEKLVRDSTPEAVLKDIMSFPSKIALNKKESADSADIRETAREVISARALHRKLFEHPEKFGTAQAIKEAYSEYRIGYYDIIEAMQGQHMNDQKCYEALAADNTGRAVEELFRKRIKGVTKSYALAKIHPADLPTARAQIEALQNRFRNGSISDMDEKKDAVAQIIAMRQVMKIKLGGDRKLNNQIPQKAFKTAMNVREVINLMSEAEQNRLIRKVTAGHGGELMKEFGRLNTYDSYINRLEAKIKADTKPQAKDVARVMAAYHIMTDPENDASGLHYPINVAEINKAADNLMKQPAFTRLMKDPEAMQFAREGNINMLEYHLESKTKELEKEKQQQEADRLKEGVQPEAGGPVAGI